MPPQSDKLNPLSAEDIFIQRRTRITKAILDRKPCKRKLIALDWHKHLDQYISMNLNVLKALEDKSET